ncbi:MAG: HEAT repeat domain-containing protein, partial [Myxococcota bacterium]|nr:HEAT repeat domain-containing protein [Myxococcota bacterium]
LKALQKGYAEIIGADSLRRLGQSLSQAVLDRDGTGAVFTLLFLLPSDAVGDLVALGAVSPNGLVRQAISDVVLLRLGRDEQSLMTLLVTATPEEAVVPLLAIGRLDIPQSIERCIELASAPQKETREAALRALRRQQSPRIQSTMLKRLEDPESDVRMEALRYLSVYRDRDMLPNIEVRMRSKLLETCSEEERRSWFLAYGIIGRLEAIPLLRGVLIGQQQLAGPERSVNDSAVRALVVIGTDESRAALEFAVRKRPEIKDFVQHVAQERRERPG